MPAMSKRSKVRRAPARGIYDRDAIDAILDEALVAHLGFVHDGQPYVIPTLQARIGDTVYIHGSSASRAIRSLGTGIPACLTVTLVDGLVLARSAFHHSINYRSVVLFGTATEVRDPVEKRAALDAVVEQIVPGRSADARGASEDELRATRVVRISIDEASAKVRTGGPKDDPEDIEAGGIWAGELPLTVVPGVPVPDDAGVNGAPEDLPTPGYVTGYRRPSRGRPAPL
jgi:uncharacterized protein